MRSDRRGESRDEEGAWRRGKEIQYSLLAPHAFRHRTLSSCPRGLTHTPTVGCDPTHHMASGPNTTHTLVAVQLTVVTELHLQSAADRHLQA